jgi:hypothetical protein
MAEIGLAGNAAHTGSMIENHEFSMRVEADSSRRGHFRWALFKAKQAYNRSESSFATKREAAAEGEKVLERRIAAWLAVR